MSDDRVIDEAKTQAGGDPAGTPLASSLSSSAPLASSLSPADLYADDNALAPDYSRFDVANRLLLTGHSHQAWPDCSLEGQIEAWEDAARYVDDKWERAFAKRDRFKRGLMERLGDRDGDYAFGSNTHELLVRLLSAMPLRERPRLLTTDGEYHSARRQFDRLAEEQPFEIVKVPSVPSADIAWRLIDRIDDRTSLVMVSHVLYRTGQIVPGLHDVALACERFGAALLVDMYHSVNVVDALEHDDGAENRTNSPDARPPLASSPPHASSLLDGLESAFIVGGGYKYLQCGEGNCFLRLPPRCSLRPIITGWYAEFDAIADRKHPGRVAYAEGGGRFAGATYDPTSHYRAARVLDFFDERGLTPRLLREVSRHQVGLLAERFDALDADPAIISRDRSIPLARLGGFLALDSPRAGDLCAALRARGMLTDHRDGVLRLGPAPYLCDRQLVDAIKVLDEAIGEVGAC